MSKRTTSCGGDVDASTPVPTIVEFLLDETSSMSSHLSPTIGGYNDFIAEQRAIDGLCLITLTKFNSTGLKTPYVDLDVNSVPDLTPKTFLPSGMTPLRDAIVSRLEALKERLTTWDIKPNVLFVVMTDGEDNTSHASIQYTRAAILEATKNNWTCVHLGATPDSMEVADSLGFAKGNSRSFSTSRMREELNTFSAATKSYRAERAAGVTSASTDYFATAR